MPELLATLDALRKVKDEDRKFAAALKGIDLGDNNAKTGEDVVKSARAKASGVDPSDVLSLQGKNADEAGFGIGLGLGYDVE